MTHEFVDLIPEELKEGIIYVSIPYSLVAHKCACGCGNEVITPLSPTDWKLTFDGESITLYPSIGNWNFDCKSHYWIRNNEINWSPKWSEEQIKAGRVRDKQNKERFYQDRTVTGDEISAPAKTSEPKRLRIITRFWSRIKQWF